MTKPKKPKAITTLSQLRDALELLSGGLGDCSATRVSEERLSRNCKSTATHYRGVIFWKPTRDEGGFYVIETGDSPADAYRNCCIALRKELAERAEKRKLAKSEPVKLLTHEPKRITYQGSP